MMRFQLFRRCMLALLLVGSILTVCLPASAQDESSTESQEGEAFVTPTQEQQDLNEQAVQALVDENYAKAISYLEEALYIGELNVSYLNLGRAYQKLGRCQKAKDALSKVSDAPRVEKPAPDFVEKKAADYLSQLPDECPTAGETSDEKAADTTSDIKGPPAWPIGVIAGGGFIMVGGGLAMFAANTIRNDARSLAAAAPENGYTQREFVDAETRANTLGAAGVAAASVGAIVTGVGVYFLVTTREESPQPAALSITPSRDGATATFRLRF